jgi:hypothetical protein
MQLQDIQSLLLQGEHRTPARYFQSLQQDFEHGRIGEPEYARRAAAAFVERRSAEPAMLAWVSEFPEDYFAQFAVGAYFLHVGWRARGIQTVQFTTETQFSLMNAYFQKALPYLYRAVELSPKPYCALSIGIHLETAGSLDLPQSFIALSEPHIEHSAEVAVTHMWALQPKWGGDDGALEAFFRRIHALDWPEESAAMLEAAHDCYQADTLCCEGRIDAAYALLAGSRHGGSPRVMATLSRYLQLQDRHAEAAEQLQGAIAYKPAPDLYERLGKSLAALGRDEEAGAAYAQAAILGDGNAAATVANRLRPRMGDPSVAAEAVRWCDLGAEQFSGDAIFERGCHFMLGLGTPKNDDAAVPYWESALEWGSHAAIWNAVLAYWQGKSSIPRDFAKARRYAAQGAEMECVPSTSVYGVLLYRGQGGPVDFEAALEHLHAAACEDDVLAISYLIRALWFGHGTEVDRAAARKWLAALRQHGDKDDVASVKEDIYSLSGWLKSGWNQWRQRSNDSQ